MTLFETNAQVVSTAPNSGVGWLANLLLEADVPVTFTPAEEAGAAWNVHPAGHVLSGQAFQRLRGILPALHRRAVFPFTPDMAGVRVEHDLPRAFGANALPTIVMVRDPRDGLRGLYECAGENTGSFAEYLQRPSPSDALCLPLPEAWAVQTLLWTTLAKARPVLIVRYEDLTADTGREMARVLAFLGVERSAEAVAQAVSLSHFERSKAVLTKAAQKAGAVAHYPRAGKAGAWHASLSAEEAGQFDGLTAYALRQARYQSSENRIVGKDGFSGLRAQASPEAQNVLERARADMEGANFPAALRRMAEAVSAVPGSAAMDAPLLATLAALRWTRLLLGENAADEDTSLCFDMLCDLHLSLANTPSVRMAQMRELTAQVPTHAGAYNIWGKLLHGQGRVEEAAAVFAAACEAGAETAQMRSNLAVLAWQMGRRDDALAQIARAAQLDPHEPSVRANLTAMEAALLAA